MFYISVTVSLLCLLFTGEAFKCIFILPYYSTINIINNKREDAIPINITWGNGSRALFEMSGPDFQMACEGSAEWNG